VESELSSSPSSNTTQRETATSSPDSCGVDWTLVVAVSRNGIIGRGDALPWKLRSDLQRFKRMTMGHCLLMGRKTFDSIGRPLPGRQTIVLSRSRTAAHGMGYQVAQDLSQVSALVDPGRQVMVVGGAEIYRHAIDHCATIWLTRVLADIDGDTRFPELDWDAWRLESSDDYDAAGVVERGDDWPSEFQIWKRLRKTS